MGTQHPLSDPTSLSEEGCRRKSTKDGVKKGLGPEASDFVRYLFSLV